MYSTSNSPSKQSSQYQNNIPLLASQAEKINPHLNLHPMLVNTMQPPGKSKNKKRKYQPLYPRTCGFSWNCYGQIVFFSNERYDLKVIDANPHLKKFKGKD